MAAQAIEATPGHDHCMLFNDLLLFFSHFITGPFGGIYLMSFVYGNATPCWTNKVLLQLLIKLVIVVAIHPPVDTV